MNSKLKLKNKPILADYQKYLRETVMERGFEKETVEKKFMLFLEECGEFAKAARKSSGMRTGKHSHEYNVAHEAADVFIYLLCICNQFDVDLEKAFREKEEINGRRDYTKR